MWKGRGLPIHQEGGKIYWGGGIDREVHCLAMSLADLNDNDHCEQDWEIDLLSKCKIWAGQQRACTFYQQYKDSNRVWICQGNHIHAMSLWCIQSFWQLCSRLCSRLATVYLFKSVTTLLEHSRGLALPRITYRLVSRRRIHSSVARVQGSWIAVAFSKLGLLSHPHFVLSDQKKVKRSMGQCR